MYDSNGLPILRKNNVLTSYIKERLDEYRLEGIEEDKLKKLADPVDQILYIDLLDILYHQCYAVKDVTEEDAVDKKIMSLNSFATVIAPNIGRINTLDLNAAKGGFRASTRVMEKLGRLNPEGLKVFITVWPDIKKHGLNKQSYSKALFVDHLPVSHRRNTRDSMEDLKKVFSLCPLW